MKTVTVSRALSSLLLLTANVAVAQGVQRSIVLTKESNVAPADIAKALSKDCPNVRLTQDPDKSDYKLEATERTSRPGLGIQHVTEFDLTLFDRDGNTFTCESDTSLKHIAKNLCRAIKTSVAVEVVDSNNLTQSVDLRGDTSGGIVGAVVNDATGRRTHTDSASIYVVVNGEHALLDCYERRTGCATLGPGKYWGEKSGDGIWVSYRMPITHAPVRNHYKIAGSW